MNVRLPSMNRQLRKLLVATAVTAALGIGQAVAAPEMSPQQMQQMQKMKEMQQLMKQELMLMTPEMRKQVQALSPANKKALLGIYAQHTRRSKQLTLRQVMHEVQSDYQSMVTGILTDNSEQAADSARRLANHRLPRGGLLPYMKLEQVTDEYVSALVPFNDTVEGSAKKLADAADRGDMAEAASYLSTITGGCVACHNMFRGVPGKTPHLIPMNNN